MKSYKKLSTLSIVVLIIFIFFLFFIITQNQSKVSLFIKSKLSSDIRFFLKDSMNTYLNVFGLKFKKEDSRVIKSYNGKKVTLKEFKNNFLNYQGPRAYISTYNDKLILISGTGLITYADINNLLSEKRYIKFRSINTNLRKVIKDKTIFQNSNYGIKGMMIDNDMIYISVSNFKKEDCINISILKGKINLNHIKFNFLFDPNQCVKKKNKYGEFQPIQSGGAMASFDDNSILLSVGEFRFRTLAQDIKSIFGKILKINKINGQYDILSIGHRNIQGLYFDKDKKVVVSTEHGPKGGDEININKNIEEINNFGWPISSYGEHYPKMVPKNAYIKAPLHKSHKEYGFTEPIKFFVPSIGITQIIKSNSKNNDKDFVNNYFFSSMGYEDRENALSIHQVQFDDNYEKILYEDKIKIGNRIRDIIFLKKENLLVGFLEKRGSIILVGYEN